MGKGEQRKTCLTAMVDPGPGPDWKTATAALDVLADVAKHDPEVDESFQRLLNQKFSVPAPLDTMTAAGLAHDVDIDEALALRALAYQDYPLEYDEDGSALFTHRQHRDFLMPHRDLVRSAEDTIPGAQDAAADLLRYIQDSDQPIAIFHDYDPDGITSANVMQRALLDLGTDPDRIDLQHATMATGFGLTEDAVRAAADRGAKMFIALDCGSTQAREMQVAADLGMTTIVVDHHGADPANPAAHHLNPEFINRVATDEPRATLSAAQALVDQVEDARQQSQLRPDDPDAKAELRDARARSKAMIARLDAISGAGSSSKTLQDALTKATKSAKEQMLINANSASQLTWKFAGEMLRQREGEIPDRWYREPMYNASIGALADAMSVDAEHIENRAFARVPLSVHIPVDDPALIARADQISEHLRTGSLAGRSDRAINQEAVSRARFEFLRHSEPVPAPISPFVAMLAEEYEEDPADPASLIRTRATMNLAKRTTRVEASLVAEGLAAETREDAAPIVASLLKEADHCRGIREQMVEEAKAQWNDKVASGEAPDLVAAAYLDSYTDDAGQARLVAMQLTREYGVPALVGVRTPDGTVKVSWTGTRRSKIGKNLQENATIKRKFETACTISAADADGHEVQSVKLGGHERVLAGSCTPESFDSLVDATSELGEKVTKKKGAWADPPRSDYKNVQARLVSPDRFRILEEQSRMLNPVANDNSPLIVSAAVKAVSMSEPFDDRGTRHATVELADGSRREVTVPKDTSEILRSGATFEASMVLRGDRPYVSAVGIMADERAS